jgi:hypothetical protein
LVLHQGVLAGVLPFPGLLTFRIDDFETVKGINAGVQGKEM